MLGQTVAQLCFDLLSRLPIVVEPKEVSVSSDSGFAMPWMFAGCERLQLTYTSVRRRDRLDSGGSRVEMWRGGLGWAYLLPSLSSDGASRAQPCSVSTSRSSNRTCGFPASGFRTRWSRVRSRKVACPRLELHQPQRLVQVLVREA